MDTGQWDGVTWLQAITLGVFLWALWAVWLIAKDHMTIRWPHSPRLPLVTRVIAPPATPNIPCANCLEDDTTGGIMTNFDRFIERAQLGLVEIPRCRFCWECSDVYRAIQKGFDLEVKAAIREKGLCGHESAYGNHCLTPLDKCSRHRQGRLPAIEGTPI